MVADILIAEFLCYLTDLHVTQFQYTTINFFALLYFYGKIELLVVF